MLSRPSHSSYVLGIIFILLIDPPCLLRGRSQVGRTFLTTPRSICTALLTPTCSLPCRYSISFRFQVLLCHSPWLLPTTKVLQFEACLLSSCTLGYLFFIDAAEIMFNAFSYVCAGWSDAFNDEFSLSVIFHFATQTARKLLPSS